MRDFFLIFWSYKGKNIYGFATIKPNKGMCGGLGSMPARAVKTTKKAAVR